jgi:sulfatase modifying factor 1
VNECCSPSAGRDPAPVRAGQVPGGGHHPIEQAAVPAQSFAMGDHHGDGARPDGETPVHAVRLSAFAVDVTPVTVAGFRAFVTATGYRTEAETYGWSAVFHLAVADGSDIVGRLAGTPWWYGVSGADWAHPGGPATAAEDDHPVVHVSWNDAQAYCRWAGRRLPTEAEWECAARGGRAGQRYPWGDELTAGRWNCNIWQGRFPSVNTAEDGFLTTAPVRAYAPNDYGLYQPIGNVWEWCADWFSPTYYAQSPASDPPGPALGAARVIRGGSYLCHDSYCNRYRNAARSSNTPDSSTGNTGFRTVAP